MKIKLCVLFGGRSVEHEVSVISALQAIASLDPEKYDVIPVYITKENEFYTSFACSCIEEYRDIPALLEKSTRCFMLNAGGRVQLLRYPLKKFGSNLLSEVDVVFPIVHGTNVEDGALQGYLKTLGVPFVGCDVTASAVGMDKYVMKTVLRENGVPVLDCVRFYASALQDLPGAVEQCEKKIGYPVIVKPVNLGSSVGISVAHNAEELRASLEDAFRYAGAVLCERAIKNLTEINCAVLGDVEKAEASECERPARSDEILSFDDKYVRSNKGMAGLLRKIPADISPERREEIRSLAVKAFRALGCNGVSRIDFMIDGDTDTVYLNEINTIPGSLSFYLWQPLGVSYRELLDRMIDLALKRKRQEDSISFSFDTNLLSNFSAGKAGGKNGGKLGGGKFGGGKLGGGKFGAKL